MSDTIMISNDLLKAVLAPEQGAGLVSLHAKKKGAWLPVTPDAAAADCDLKMASFLMVPYSNRIENGKFSFRGREYSLRNPEKHAMHGDTRGRPWKTEKRAPEEVCFSFRSADCADVNWPWPFDAQADFAVAGNRFVQRLRLWNRGSGEMPAGFGWHPYFSRHLTRPGEPVLLQMRYASIFPDANDNRIPSGPAAPTDAARNFAAKKELRPEQFLDMCCRGYDGRGSIEWPESGVSLEFSCTPNLGHLVVYNPGEKPYFAVEPVTNATNGVNLLARGDQESGVVVLQPGDCLAAEFAIAIEA